MEMGIDAKSDAAADAKAGCAADAKAEVKERVQRVRIGLTGLGVVFLLVMIGAAITNWGGSPANSAANQALANAATEPNEPLAEIGAAPGESSAANSASSNKQ